ncbi:MAG: Lar family restriction alleviation protein [Synergistaceae bacterium]|nr:Lar family restriction alleviation protein [Synergistaceae bacterium]
MQEEQKGKIKLKPCPFCGGSGTLTAWSDPNGVISAHIHCDKCGVTGPFMKTIEDAADMWNTRDTDRRTQNE